MVFFVSEALINLLSTHFLKNISDTHLMYYFLHFVYTGTPVLMSNLQLWECCEDMYLQVWKCDLPIQRLFSTDFMTDLTCHIVDIRWTSARKSGNHKPNFNSFVMSCSNTSYHFSSPCRMKIKTKLPTQCRRNTESMITLMECNR